MKIEGVYSLKKKKPCKNTPNTQKAFLGCSFLHLKTSLGVQPFNEFFLHIHCIATYTHFHMKGCASGLVLKQRYMEKTTCKWLIA